MNLKLIWHSCIFLLLFANISFSQAKTFVILWFDTEDYIDPISDDAALRIAQDLNQMGVRATFKVVGEKARTLETRQRQDVIEALAKHCIGYHSNWHSIQPTPAVYEEHLGLLEGAAEFMRREHGGFEDISRIFGVAPACYGQPGNSWAPQSNIALRHLGIHVYLDAGNQIGLNDQPFWYGGLLYVYEMGPYQIRAELDHQTPQAARFQKFDEAVRHLSQSGGGLISTYYHPTEFEHTEFWDAANFAEGRVKDRQDWIAPKRRSHEDAERCFAILHAYVTHMRETPGVQFIAADDLLRLYANPIAPPVDRFTLARHFKESINYLSTDSGDLSAADIFLELLGLPAHYVDGPVAPGATSYTEHTIPAFLFDASVRDVASFIETNDRLPSEVFLGSQTLSLADFAATLAEHLLSPGPIRVVHGNLGFEQYISKDAKKSFSWPIHPKNFAPSTLLDVAKLQAWTLKPARLR
jgi:hypothetical protein